MDRFYRYFLNLSDEDPTELYTQSQNKRKKLTVWRGVTRSWNLVEALYFIVMKASSVFFPLTRPTL